MEAKLSIFKVDDGAVTWVAAENRQEVIARVAEANGFTVHDYMKDYGAELEVTELPDGEKLTVTTEEAKKETKTAAEWAAEGRGIVACTEY